MLHYYLTVLVLQCSSYHKNGWLIPTLHIAVQWAQHSSLRSLYMVSECFGYVAVHIGNHKHNVCYTMLLLQAVPPHILAVSPHISAILPHNLSLSPHNLSHTPHNPFHPPHRWAPPKVLREVRAPVRGSHQLTDSFMQAVFRSIKLDVIAR